MSWGVIIAAVLDAELPTSEKMTLLAIARHADDQGRCWPSVARIERLSGLKRSTVFQCMSELERKGALSREERKGKSTLYTVKAHDLDPSIKRTRPFNGPLPVHLMDPTRPFNGPLPVHLMDPEDINRRTQGRSSSEEPKDEISSGVAPVVAALGIVSPGMVIEAETLIDGWMKTGVAASALLLLAQKARGKNNPISYLAKIAQPEIERAMKEKADRAERQRQAEQGPDWPQVMKAWAAHRQWPYAMPGIGPEPWKRSTRVPAPLLEQYANEIEQERERNEWFKPAEDQSIGI